MTLPKRAVSLFAGGAQNWTHLDRGIPRYVVEHLRALLRVSPTVIDSVLLDHAGPLTGNLNWLLDTGLLEWGRDQRPLGRRGGKALPSVYHIMSPFEPTSMQTMWPTWARSPDVATVVTVYDLIPLIFPDHYLPQARGRVEYRARAEMLRHVDGVLAISETTARDLVERLEVPPDRVHVIHAGATDTFGPMYASAEEARQHLAAHHPSIRPGFMLYVGGFEFRKNLDMLIRAYARVPPAVRAAHQMVITCKLLEEQRAALQRLAHEVGLRASDLVLTGFVVDADLGALYRACALFVFPSLYEGSGLPVLEAMACGAPVAASSTSTGPELLGDAEATFDPSSADAIAGCLTELVTSVGTLERLAARSRERAAAYTWTRVARDTLTAYEQVLEQRTRRVMTRRRPRIALVTPWPPDRSGIADYNLRLAIELGQRVDVEIVVPRAQSEYHVPLEHGVQLRSARSFDPSRNVRRPDRIVYCMGNSEFHGYVYDLLRRHRGAVVFHDVRLTGFYGWYSGTENPADPAGRLAEWVEALYGDRLPPEATGSVPAWERQLGLGIYMTQDVQRHAERCLVHSEMARSVLTLDRDPMATAPPVSVVPFGMPQPAGREYGSDVEAPLIVSLGYVSEVKGLATLIGAFALLAAAMPQARLVVAGPADDGELERWREYAAVHAPGAAIEIPGAVSVMRYHELLRAADVAVQLRLISNGEASAAVADCVAAGVPTIVTEIGWLAQLPDTAVSKVSVGVTAQQLCLRLSELIADASQRSEMGDGARAHAAGSRFADVADAYLKVLEL